MRSLAIAIAIALALPATARAQPAKKSPETAAKPDKKNNGASPAGKVKAQKGGKEKLFDFTGLELSGSLRMPQLLYFLERAAEELERASLERRSFIPEMVRSIDEDTL